MKIKKMEKITPEELRSPEFEKALDELLAEIGKISRQIRWNKAYLPGIVVLALSIGLLAGWLIWG